MLCSGCVLSDAALNSIRAMNCLRKSIEFFGLFGIRAGSSLAFVDGKRHLVDVLHVMMQGERSARQVPCGGFCLIKALDGA
jgi:hypothetical protein